MTRKDDARPAPGAQASPAPDAIAPRAPRALTPRRALLAGGACGAALVGFPAIPRAQPGGEPLKLAVLTDMSGILADLGGAGTVAAMTLAIEDLGGAVNGRPVQLLKGDHLNRADIGAGIARRWYDEGVTAIFDVGNTSVALGVQNLAREKNRAVIFLSSASADLTGAACSPNGLHWTYNNYSQALGAVRVLREAGAKTWFFITVDYTYGRNVQRDTTGMIEAGGGRVVGSLLHPFDMTDYSSPLLQARASRADAILLATTTGHAVNLVKQADEFGMRRGAQKVMPLSITLHDVKALGTRQAEGIIETAPYYWDQNDATRAFAERYRARMGGRMPNMVQASAYGAAKHYLEAVRAAGTDEAGRVLAQMRATPINDFMTKDGRIRPDGRVLRDMWIFRAKGPAESRGEWDLMTGIGHIPAAESFAPP
ncbi:ABC transporter substrate-binding protein, partial [Roseomonas sp. NAR14]